MMGRTEGKDSLKCLIAGSAGNNSGRVFEGPKKAQRGMKDGKWGATHDPRVADMLKTQIREFP